MHTRCAHATCAGFDQCPTAPVVCLPTSCPRRCVFLSLRSVRPCSCRPVARTTVQLRRPSSRCQSSRAWRRLGPSRSSEQATSPSARTTTTPPPPNCSTRFPAPCSSRATRSEEHTSELQSLAYLVCRLLLEKKK